MVCFVHLHFILYNYRFLPELRESLLLDYASMLVGHNSLWQVGLLYLDHCGSAGVAMAQAVLQRIPLTDDSRAMKVIQMASDRDFDNVGKWRTMCVGCLEYSICFINLSCPEHVEGFIVENNICKIFLIPVRSVQTWKVNIKQNLLNNNKFTHSCKHLPCDGTSCSFLGTFGCCYLVGRPVKRCSFHITSCSPGL